MMANRWADQPLVRNGGMADAVTSELELSSVLNQATSVVTRQLVDARVLVASSAHLPRMWRVRRHPLLLRLHRILNLERDVGRAPLRDGEGAEGLELLRLICQ